MSQEITVLLITAASIGFFHTLLGPDHYLPFIAISKATGWSIKKTLYVCFFCGIGHIFSSIILGTVGIIVGLSVSKVEMIEGFRGNLAAWLLIGFGLIYIIVSLKNLYSEHSHSHIIKKDKNSLTFWMLFLIFVFGPCEPLIPLLMYPAAKNNAWGVFLVTSVFAITTLFTMTTMVFFGKAGLSQINFKPFSKYAHTLAGFCIFASGLAIQYFVTG